MIELKRVAEKSYEELDYYHIYVDKIFCEDAYASGSNKRSTSYNSNSLNSTIKIKNQLLSEFKDFDYISLDYYFDWLNFSATVFISSNLHKEGKERELLSVEINLYPELEKWREEYSFAQYRATFDFIWKEKIGESQELRWGGQEAISVWTRYEIPRSEESINNILAEQESNFKEIHRLTLREITASSQIKILSTSFNFPEEIKIFCNQYLLYFAQFLQDLGINATSNLKEEAGKVLFSVTPTDDVEALDKIREALAVYLNLPASPISDIEYSENFALMRLQQQVRNLQHAQQMAKTEILSAQYALNLAQQNIDNQNRIIVQQNSTVENLNKVIEKITSNSIMTDSLDEKDKENFEAICEGLRVGESKWLRELTGIGLSPGKFIKSIVENTFGIDGEKKSVLGLDGETERENN